MNGEQMLPVTMSMQALFSEFEQSERPAGQVQWLSSKVLCRQKLARVTPHPNLADCEMG